MENLKGRFVDPTGAPIGTHIATETRRSNKPRPPALMEAMGNHVVLWFDRNRLESMTKSGLVLPEGTIDNHESPIFEVLSVGPDCEEGVSRLQVGDVVTVWREVKVYVYMFNGGQWEYTICSEDKVTGRVDVSHPEWVAAYKEYARPTQPK